MIIIEILENNSFFKCLVIRIKYFNFFNYCYNDMIFEFVIIKYYFIKYVLRVELFIYIILMSFYSSFVIGWGLRMFLFIEVEVLRG